MKKIFAIMLSVISMFMLASCDPFEPEVRAEKPVIYLYPTENMDVTVKPCRKVQRRLLFGILTSRISHPPLRSCRH